MPTSVEWLSDPQAAKLLGLQLHALIDRGDLVAEIVPADFLERVRVKPRELRHLHPEWTWERYG